MEKTQNITDQINSHNSDVMFHSLTGDTVFLSKLFFTPIKELPRTTLTPNRLNFFEYKLFTIGYFLNFLRKEDNSKFEEFLSTCINQLLQEIDSLTLDAEEGLLHMPGQFHKGKEYIVEKLQYYIEDFEKSSTDPNYFPKFTYLSIVKHPLENTTSDFFDRFQSISVNKEFIENYKKAIWVLELRAKDNAKFKVEKDNLTGTIPIFLKAELVSQFSFENESTVFVLSLSGNEKTIEDYKISMGDRFRTDKNGNPLHFTFLYARNEGIAFNKSKVIGDYQVDMMGIILVGQNALRESGSAGNIWQELQAKYNDANWSLFYKNLTFLLSINNKALPDLGKDDNRHLNRQALEKFYSTPPKWFINEEY